MKRKLIKQGQGTITISLPSDWVKQNSLTKDTEVDVLIENNILKIYPGEKRKDKKVARIKYPGKVDFLKRVLINLYRKGYDEIIIESKDKIPMSRFSSKLIELLGFQVMDHSETQLIIKNIASQQEEEFNAIYRRFYRLTLNFAEEVYDGLKNKKSLKEISTIDKEVNKLYNYCCRLLNLKIKDFEEQGLFYIQAITYIEQVGDQLDEICSDFEGVRISDSSIGIFNKVISYFRSIYELSFDFDYNKLLKAEGLRVDLFKELKAEMNNSKKNKDLVLCSYLHVILENLFHIETYFLNVEDHLNKLQD